MGTPEKISRLDGWDLGFDTLVDGQKGGNPSGRPPNHRLVDEQMGKMDLGFELLVKWGKWGTPKAKHREAQRIDRGGGHLCAREPPEGPGHRQLRAGASGADTAGA